MLPEIRGIQVESIVWILVVTKKAGPKFRRFIGKTHKIGIGVYHVPFANVDNAFAAIKESEKHLDGKMTVSFFWQTDKEFSESVNLVGCRN